MRVPGGVMIIGILSIIGGIFSIMWGMAVASLGGLSWITGAITFAETIRTWGGGAFGSGLFNVLVGIVQIAVGSGMLALKRWAWLLALISNGAALIHPIIGLFSGNLWAIFGLIIPGIIFFYLMQPRVREVFGVAAR